MHTICAWCHKDISTEEWNPSKNDSVSHGVCEDCAQFFRSNKPTSIEKFINRIDIPIIVIDKNTDVLSANKYASVLFNKEILSPIQQPTGDVMECAYARLPEGCGRTTHCTGCTIRQSVTKTFETGEPMEKIEAYQYVVSDKNSRYMKMLISTKKVDKVVFLRIDSREEAE